MPFITVGSIVIHRVENFDGNRKRGPFQKGHTKNSTPDLKNQTTGNCVCVFGFTSITRNGNTLAVSIIIFSIFTQRVFQIVIRMERSDNNWHKHIIYCSKFIVNNELFAFYMFVVLSFSLSFIWNITCTFIQSVPIFLCVLHERVCIWHDVVGPLLLSSFGLLLSLMFA